MPKVVVHNSVSLDGSLTNFEPNMQLHYQIVAGFQPQLYMVGSNTVKTGIEMIGGVPPEQENDFKKPNKDAQLSYWVIPDTKGALQGKLHYCRRYEYCRDVIVLVSKLTPQEYLTYLKERNYDHHVVGENEVDLGKALQILSETYAATRILADTGRILSNALLEEGLVSQLSLLVHPVIVGKNFYSMFSNVTRTINLKLSKKRTPAKGFVWLLYDVC